MFLRPAQTFWDVDLYRWWMWQGLNDGTWPVLDGPWVYPVGALVPMLTAATGGTDSTTGYALAWSLWVTAFNAVGLVALLHAPRVVGHRHIERTTAGAWWWVGFTALLGPVAMGRLDAVVAPLVVGALVVALRRPRMAAALLTAGAWVKAAPGALLLALVVVVRRPWREVMLPAALVCAGVVALVVLGGGREHLLSFLTEQGERGLQAESVGATPWLLASLVDPEVGVELNAELITWEVHGPGAQGAADALGVLFLVGIAAAGVFLWWCARRLGPRLWSDETARAQLLVRGALLIATLLIVLNKVGSPQFIGWIAPPVAVALALRLPGWRSTAWFVAAIAGATQLIFPWGYPQITTGGVGMTLVLAARNVALVVLAATVVLDLLRETHAPRLSSGDPDDDPAAASHVAADEDALVPGPTPEHQRDVQPS
ncbi:MAG: glycosyltransferase 87 family protein [Cellulomonas sp.]|uniref:glycosyltransferase 87 family protein n=1 Tax=Cellulomonas sp. TaxID=40001 RepID=UPI002582A9DF|nr:glycosyltransferase 87 family protein [Cellulomonas sp.]MCR6704682.1 glycosyltransferase 87 family protein [Cellulomonas sp.]